MAVWLGGTAAMVVVATQNFYIIDRLLEAKPNPMFAANLESIGDATARELLRYLSSELNRLYFQYWNLAQLAVGIAALWMVVKLPNARKAKWQIVAMLGIVLFMTALIVPGILSVGRAIDFVPREPPPPSLRTFGLLHAAYTVLDGVLLILGIIATVSLVNSESQPHPP
jgi:hypothetical protein